METHFFEAFFEERGGFSEVNGKGWSTVACPFPHKRIDGTYSLEEHPSAHVHLEDRHFHCKVCSTEKLSEAEFLIKLHPGMPLEEAILSLNALEQGTDKSYQPNLEMLERSPEAQKWIRDLGIETVKDELQIGFDGYGLTFPVYIYNELMDIRTYSPQKIEDMPKAKGLPDSTCNIYPFDLWVEDERPTLLCAGEKDCAIARSRGFNAITFTGGEGSVPKLFKHSFKGKKVYIVYDNDMAGKEGGERTAVWLKEIGAEPYLVTKHWLIAKEEKEDIHDFFMKYGRTGHDLQELLDATSEFTEAEYKTTRERLNIYPLISLQESTKGEYAYRLVSTRVAVISTYEMVYRTPTLVSLTLRLKETNRKVDSILWSLDNKNLAELLRLIEVKTDDQMDYFRSVGMSRMEYSKKIHYIQVKVLSTQTVSKAIVADDVENEMHNAVRDDVVAELPVYVLGNKLEDGKKYRLVYQPATTPTRQNVVGIVKKIEESDNSVSSFKMTQKIRETLTCFQGIPKVKMEELYTRAKAFTAPELQKDIFFAVELFFHTPLYFRFGNRIERGYLDVMIAGESETGKSQTARQLSQHYGLGAVVSLKTATLAGLIGGANKESNGGFKTRLGIIPRSHKGAMIFEEFSGGGKEIISKLTEVRTSDRVQLTRVDGVKTADAMVRKLTLSNQATRDGVTIPLRKYANGIQVLLDLIGAAEDIRRYDFCMLVDKPDQYTSPTTVIEQESYEKEAYLNRIRWIWSRTPDQIIISPEEQEYTVQLAQDLNERFDSHISFLGAGGWKKLIRIAIAVAATTANMDESGENLIVEKEHIQWAYLFLKRVYDNDLFRLPQFVEEERQYRTVDVNAIEKMRDWYTKYPIFMRFLNQGTTFTTRQLEAMSGLSKDEFTLIMNRLYGSYFIQMQNHQVSPSEKFRLAFRQVVSESSTKLNRTGEF